ncbi:hypothetical protein SAMN02745216_01473 [Desulfatibacillum alkenivorans DSM 16219]|jgi:hypothetical protein|uniref:Phospholipid/glycerol acyltransferase domain-containing protein n=1 Tax=Desulfatibacillum alkenivorans DSM 16219 TaxID=1121393 RepID=A0A1M6IGI3_9BACT|nr:hypothetical protein [Desulfatibacillum alkenivorans]SHJ33543.1 hypothetical protein SAMN02745216_01473 [Desulfatibacillum alkenivorans DSM 16219]
MKQGPDTPGVGEKNAGIFESGKGMGVRLKEMQPFYDFVLNRLVERAELHNGEALIPENGRPVVIIVSHGPGLAWVPILALVSKHYVDSGCGDLIGGMVPHKAVFLVPGFKEYYKRVLGTPTEVKTVDHLTRLLKTGRIQVTGTAPEGANSFLSFKEYVGPFRSRGMIAAAIRSNANLVLVAHQGAETWNRRLRLPLGLSLPNTFGLRGVNLTLPPYKKLDNYVALAQLYTPSMTEKDFKTLSPRECSLMLNVEAERIRAEMNLMTDKVKTLLAGRRMQRLIERGAGA